MLVKWKMSIGYPGACRQGEVDIDDEELEGLSDEEREVLIGQVIWEDATQHVDVYPVDDE